MTQSIEGEPQQPIDHTIANFSRQVSDELVKRGSREHNPWQARVSTLLYIAQRYTVLKMYRDLQLPGQDPQALHALEVTLSQIAANDWQQARAILFAEAGMTRSNKARAVFGQTANDLL